jgi:hypothetical protein
MVGRLRRHASNPLLAIIGNFNEEAALKLQLVLAPRRNFNTAPKIHFAASGGKQVLE